MSRGDIIGGAAVPLTDALPWEASLNSKRMFLVNDSMGTDGRFLLYTLASQVLSSSSSGNTNSMSSAANTASQQKRGRVLWLACGPVGEGQILQGLKKIGCDKTALSQAVLAAKQSGDSTEKESSLLTIRSLATELSDSLLDSNEPFSEQDFVKRLYQYILKEWLPTETEDGHTYNNWIIVDDVSALANLLGETLVYGLLLALNARSHKDKSNGFGLVVRCSNDYEAASLPSFSGSSVASSGPPEWFGAGGGALSSRSNTHYSSTNMDAEIPWERSLMELADGVLDVLPLTSGYTRELHGRIVMTQMPHGRGWLGDGEDPREKNTTSLLASRRSTQQKQQLPMQIINYCITDQKIVAYLI